MPTLVGTKLDKYEIQSEVGHGGMAVVYRGLDTVLSREVAIKVLHPHMAAREESRARLRREALTVAKLRHENILEIYDYSGEESADSYLVTEFIHGMTLREWLDTRWRPRPALAALVIHRLCMALAHAHKVGIVHRDIKPENVMIREDGCLKLMDFGIAQIIDHQKLTMTGQLLGSPAYMAPELISGKPIDARTDLFAVGIMLYQLATGALPFSGRNPHEVLSRIADAEYPKACTICPLVDDELEAIIAKALAREPDLRYQSAEDFGRELERYLDEVGIPALQEEVTGYFKDCDRYVDQLDKRVCTTLMQRAEAAAKAGHSARAIRLLGRVLELEKDQKQAKSMLSRLRTRERTIRRIMIGGAGIAGTALISGGAVLLYMIPPNEANLPRDEHTPDARVLPSTKAPPGKAPPAQTSDPTVGPAVEPPPDPLPRKTTTTRPPDPVGKAPVKAMVPGARCSLQVTGMPVSVIGAGGHYLQIGSEPKKPLKEAVVELKFDGDSEQVQVSGAMYNGLRSIRRAECVQGATVELAARPRVAKLNFIDDQPGTTVSCLSVPPCPSKQPYLISSNAFPDIPVTQSDTEITLELKAAGYQSRTTKFRIHPGNNAIKINLTPNP
ncbi:MAG: protein kinase [Myxococcales bacterium]|nr:protein kinase [Myxococcales bacterium]